MAVARGEPPRFVRKKLDLPERTFAGVQKRNLHPAETPGRRVSQSATHDTAGRGAGRSADSGAAPLGVPISAPPVRANSITWCTRPSPAWW
jgi:hypothetical protein